MKTLLLSSFVVIFGCAKWTKQKHDPAPDNRLQNLSALYEEKLAEALEIRDQDTGWLSRNDCDGMIWAGKYAASRGVDDVNIEAAEYPGVPGKFGRRPDPWCWNQEQGDVGSKTEWSRDMFIAGLLPYAWLKQRRDILERHAAYGKENNWQMGEPLADGRVLYTPSVIAVLHKAIIGLGGFSSSSALWPDIFPSGLVDYQAHLQIMSIWVQGEIADKLDEGDAIPSDGTDHDKVPANALTVSDTMYNRLEEHAARQPDCPLYQAVYGMYTGDMAPALNSLLGLSSCDYLRCHDDQCFLADWIFAASLTLNHFQAP